MKRTHNLISFVSFWIVASLLLSDVAQAAAVLSPQPVNIFPAEEITPLPYATPEGAIPDEMDSTDSGEITPVLSFPSPATRPGSALQPDKQPDVHDTISSPAAPLTGRLLFAPTIDADDDPASNPVANSPAPVLDLLGDVGGVVMLAVQLDPDDPGYIPIAVPVTFRVWNETGTLFEQTVRSDAWGAASVEVVLKDTQAGYSYQASAPGFGETEERRFRFDPAHVSFTLHPDGAQLVSWQGLERTLFTLYSPVPLEAGRDEVRLVIVRRPSFSPDAESVLQPIFETLDEAGVGIPFPDVIMQIVDTRTARVEVRLPPGDYGIVGSLAVNSPSAEHFFSQPLQLNFEEETALPSGEAIWASPLEYEPGRTLVEYRAPEGQAFFDLVDVDQTPEISDDWEGQNQLVKLWRTGPFEWQEETYDVQVETRVDDGKKVVALQNFDYDPISRRYTLALKSLQEEVITDTLTVEVLGPGGVVIKQEVAQVKLLPGKVLYYAVEVPAELGQPHGLRVTLDDPLDGFVKGLAAAARSVSSTISKYGSVTFQVKFYVQVLEFEVANAAFTYPPGSWGGCFLCGDLNELRTLLWDILFDGNIVLGAAGVSETLSFTVGLTVDRGACPTDAGVSQVEARLQSLAGDLNAMAGKLEWGASIDLPGIPIWWILQAWVSGSGGVRATVSASGLTLSVGGQAYVDISGNAGIKLSGFSGDIKAAWWIVRAQWTLADIVLSAATIKNWQVPQKDECDPDPPDDKPPDDRQDVWQGIAGFYDGETYDETIDNLSALIQRAQEQDLWRAERMLTLSLRETELARFGSNAASLNGYLDDVETIVAAANDDLQGIISGTVPISPSQTITEALVIRMERATADLEALPYVQEQQQLLDATEVAERLYLELQEQELELQQELRQLFTGDVVGVVAAGFAEATLSVLAEAGLPAQLVSPWPAGADFRGQPAPYFAPELAPRALVVPSGALHTLAGSPEVRQWLDAYVAGGGLLVVFTQAFGDEWAALPGGEVAGVGYEEDQRCQHASVQAAMHSDWLVWMGIEKPDIQVDGAFTAWPANASVLLRRTMGTYAGYPAMVEYPYGEGTVLATVAYGDWAWEAGFWWGDDWQMTRSILNRAYLLARGQDVGDAFVADPDSTVIVSFPITNTSTFTTTSVGVVLPVRLGYWGNDYSQSVPLSLAPGESDLVIAELSTPPVRRGVHDWTQVGLYRLRTAVNDTHGGSYRVPGPFVYVRSPVILPEVTANLQAEHAEAYLFQTVNVTATVSSHVDVTRTVVVRGQYDLPAEPITLTVSPQGQATHVYSVWMDGSKNLSIVLYDEDGKSLDSASTVINIPPLQLEANPFIPPVLSDGSVISTAVTNHDWEHISAGMVVLTMTSPSGAPLWTDSEILPGLAPGETITPTFTLTLPQPVEFGDYQLVFGIGDGRGLMRVETIPLPAQVTTELVFNQPFYRIRETMQFTTTMHNTGRFTLQPTLTITVPAIGFTATQVLSLPVGSVVSIPVSQTLPVTLTAGVYEVQTAIRQNSVVSHTYTFVIPPSEVEVVPWPGEYRAGETFTVTLRNPGGIDTTASYTISLVSREGSISQIDGSTPLLAGAEAPLPPLSIPGQAAQGSYALRVTTRDQETGQSQDWVWPLTLKGVAAVVQANPERLAYLVGETFTATGQVSVTAGTLVSAALDLQTITDMQMGDNQRVDTGDQSQYIEQAAPDIALDAAGNAYAVWSDDRDGGGDIYFAYKPVTGTWGSQMRVNDEGGIIAGSPAIAVNSAGNAYAVWSDWRNGDQDIFFAYKPITGTWGANVQVNDDGTSVQDDPAIAVDAAGNAYAVWSDARSGGWEVYFAYRPITGTWQANVQINDNTNSHQIDPDIAVDAAGNAYAIWEDRRSNNWDLYSSYRPFTGTWQTNEKVNDDIGYKYDPAIAVDAAGNACAVWQDRRSDHYHVDIYYAHRPVTGTWGTNEKVNDDHSTELRWNPEIVVDVTGDAYTVWQDDRNDNYDIYFAYRPVTGTWGANVQINDDVGDSWQGGQSIAVDVAGEAHVVWGDKRNGDGDIYYDHRLVADVWDGNIRVNDDTGGINDQGNPAIAVEPDGSAYAVWEDERMDNSDSDIYVARLPVTGDWEDGEPLHDDAGQVDQYRPSIDVDAAGTAYAVWEDRRNGIGDTDIYFAYRPAGGTWTTDVRVNDDAGTSSQRDPVMAVDAAGNAYAVWEDNRSGNWDIYYAYRPVTGAWGTNVKVNDDSGNSQWYPVIALDIAGNAYAVWKDWRNGDPDIYFAYKPITGTWGTNVRVDDDAGTSRQDYPTLAVDPDGNAYAAWMDERNGNQDIYFAYRPITGTWGANAQINDDVGTTSQRAPAIAVDPTGNAYTVWMDERNDGVNEDIYYAYRPVTGAWETNARVNDDPITTTVRHLSPAIAVETDGDAYVTWVDDRHNGNDDIYFAYRPAGGTWGTNEQVDDSDKPYRWDPVIAVDAAGNAYAVWDDERNVSYVDIYFAYRPDGGTWGTNERVSDNPGTSDQWAPAVAVNANGDAYAVWTDERDGSLDTFFAYKPVTSTWEAHLKINDDNGWDTQWGSSIGVDAAGNAYAVWDDERNGDDDIYFAYKPVTGTWGANLRVDDDAGTAQQYDSAIAVDAAGNAYAVWADYRNGDYDVYFAYRPFTGAWGTNERVDDDPSAETQGEPAIAVDASGNAFAVWEDYRNGNYDIYFAYRPAGGVWGTNVRIDDNTGETDQRYPDIAVDVAGNAYAVWQNRDGNKDIYFAYRPAGGTWGADIQVNDDGTYNYFAAPTIAVDTAGNGYVVWSDKRLGAPQIYFAIVSPPDSSPVHTLNVTTANLWPFSESFGPLSGSTGKFALRAVLRNELGQVLDTDEQPFYVFPEGTTVTLETDRSVYRPGQTVQVSGLVTNTAVLTANLSLMVTAGGETLLTRTLELAPGEGSAYSATLVTVTDTLLIATAGPAQVTEQVVVAIPQVEAALAAPSLVGHAPFSVTLAVTNTGVVPAALTADFGGQITRTATLDPGDVSWVQASLAITDSTVLTVTLSGDVTTTIVQPLTQGEEVSLSLEGDEGNLRAGAVTISYTLTNTGSLPAQIIVSATPYTYTRELMLLPGQVYNGDLPLDVPPGAHSGWLAVYDSQGHELTRDEFSFWALGSDAPEQPNLSITGVELTPQPVGAGQSVTATLILRNKGGTGPAVAGIQLFETLQQWVITPTASLTQSFTFHLDVPDDMLAGGYIGQASVDGDIQPFTMTVAGADVLLALTLDKPTYLPGDVVSLDVLLTENAGVSGDYNLSLRYLGAEEYVTVTVPAGQVVQHGFTFTATTSGRASVILGHTPSDAGQRVIMIDSLPVMVSQPSQGVYLTSDKLLYNAGETIHLTLAVTGALGTVIVMGPMELALQDGGFLMWSPPAEEEGLGLVQTGAYPLSYTLPAEMRTGRYTFLTQADGQSYAYPVDVRGWTVTSRRITLDKPRYAHDDSISAVVEFLNDGDAPILGLRLSAWVAPPGGEGGMLLSPPVSRMIDLQPGLNVFTVTGALNTSFAGPHRLLVNLGPPDSGWRVAGAAAQFDVGWSHLVELTTGHGNYAQGGPGIGRLDVYGFGNTQVVVTATNGSTLLDQQVELLGFDTFTFTIPTANLGDYLLVAQSVDQNGNTDQLVRAYAVPPLRDTLSPQISLTYPNTVTVITTAALTMTLEVTGNVSDDSGEVSVLVNGEVITPTAGGDFTTTLVVEQGFNMVSAVAIDPSNNITYTPIVPVYLLPTREVTLSADRPTAQVGEQITFTTRLTASGVLSDVLFSQMLPTGMVTDVVILASNGEMSVGALDPAWYNATWQGDLESTHPVTVTVRATLLAPGTLTQNVVVYWGLGFVEESNVVEVVVGPAPPPAALIIDKAVSDLNGGSLYPGDLLSYTVTITNPTGELIGSVTLTDTMSPYAAYVAGSAEPAPDVAQEQLLVWQNRSFTPGVVSYQYQDLVGERAVGQFITNTFQSPVEVVTATVGPVSQHPLSIGKTALDANGTPLDLGDTIFYTITITNSSSNAISGVTISDTIPAHTTYVAGSANPAATLSEGVLVWSSQTIPPGTTTFVFEITVDSDATGQSISNVASFIWDNQPGRPPVYSDPAQTPSGWIVEGAFIYLPVIFRP